MKQRLLINIENIGNKESINKQCDKHTLFYNDQQMTETSVTYMKIENKSNKHEM